MNIIEPNSTFTSYVDFTLSVTDNEVLNLLYYPIIGKDAYVLYNLLLTNRNLKEDNVYIDHDLFVKKINFTISEFLLARTKLESIKLLETYRSEVVINNDNKIRYIYHLLPPATANKFFNDPILFSLLSNNINKKELSDLKIYFKHSNNKFNDFVNVSSKLDDVFVLSDNDSFIKEDFKDKKYKKAYSINLANIEKKLLSLNTFDLSAIKEYENIIENYLTLYQLDEDTAIDIILNSISTTNEFDEKTFIEKCRNAKSYKVKKDINLINFDKYLNEEDLEKYKNKSIKEFLTNLYNGEPKLSLVKLDEIFNRFDFTPDIANAIIEYVSKKNNGYINDVFVERICLKLKYEKVNDLFSAIQSLKRLEYKDEEYLKIKKGKSEKPINNKKKKDENKQDSKNNDDSQFLDNLKEFDLKL